jgi:Nuclease-related domain
MDDLHRNREENGSAGASARREHERRKAGREQRAREKHPRLGGLLLALNGAPEHEVRWARGAEGEELVATALTSRCGDGVVLLHDRRIPGRRANIDHIAIAPSGVWVIDTKRYKGRVQVSNPLFGKTALRIAGRDQSKLVEGLTAQVAAVTRAIREAYRTVPVRGCFCFVDAELPLLSTPTINGFACLQPKGLAKRLNASGPVPPDTVALLGRELAATFRAA